MNEQLQAIYNKYKTVAPDVTEEMFINGYNLSGDDYLSAIDEVLKKKEPTEPTTAENIQTQTESIVPTTVMEPLQGVPQNQVADRFQQSATSSVSDITPQPISTELPSTETVSIGVNDLQPNQPITTNIATPTEQPLGDIGIAQMPTFKKPNLGAVVYPINQEEAQERQKVIDRINIGINEQNRQIRLENQKLTPTVTETQTTNDNIKTTNDTYDGRKIVTDEKGVKYVDYGNNNLINLALMPTIKTEEQQKKEREDFLKDNNLDHAKTKFEKITLDTQFGDDKYYADGTQVKDVESYNKDVWDEVDKGNYKLIEDPKTSGYLLTPEGRYVWTYAKQELVDTENKRREDLAKAGEEHNKDNARQRLGDALNPTPKQETHLTQWGNELYKETGYLLDEKDYSNLTTDEDRARFFATKKADKELKENPNANYNDIFQKEFKEQSKEQFTPAQYENAGDTVADMFLESMNIEADKHFNKVGAKEVSDRYSGYNAEAHNKERNFLNKLKQDPAFKRQVGEWLLKEGQYGVADYKERFYINANTQNKRTALIDQIQAYTDNEDNTNSEVQSRIIEQRKNNIRQQANKGNFTEVEKLRNDINSSAEIINKNDDNKKQRNEAFEGWRSNMTVTNEEQDRIDKLTAQANSGNDWARAKVTAINTVDKVINGVFKDPILGVLGVVNIVVGSDRFQDVLDDAKKRQAYGSHTTDNMFNVTTDYKLNGVNVKEKDGRFFSVDKNGIWTPLKLSYSDKENLEFVKTVKSFSITGAFSDTVGQIASMAGPSYVGKFAYMMSGLKGLKVVKTAINILGKESAITKSLVGIRNLAGKTSNQGAVGWFLQTYADNFQEGKQNGMNNSQANMYALMQSAITGVLSKINPDAKFFNTSYENLQQQLITNLVQGNRNGIINALKSFGKDVIKHGGKEVVGENIQEFVEAIAGQGYKTLQQPFTDAKFDAMTWDQVMETAIATTLSTGGITIGNRMMQGRNPNIIQFDGGNFDLNRLTKAEKMVMLSRLDTSSSFDDLKTNFLTNNKSVDRVERELTEIKRLSDKIPNATQYSLEANAFAVQGLHKIEQLRSSEKSADPMFKDKIQAEVTAIETKIKEVLDNDIKEQQGETETVNPNPTTETPNTETVNPNPTTETPNTETVNPNPTTETPNTETVNPNPTTETPNTETVNPNPTTETPNTETEIIKPNLSDIHSQISAMDNEYQSLDLNTDEGKNRKTELENERNALMENVSVDDIKAEAKAHAETYPQLSADYEKAQKDLEQNPKDKTLKQKEKEAGQRLNDFANESNKFNQLLKAKGDKGLFVNGNYVPFKGSENTTTVEQTTKALSELDKDVLANSDIPLPQLEIDGHKNIPSKSYNKNNPEQVAKAYHTAKEDGTNPELVTAVEKLLKPKETPIEAKKKEIEKKHNITILQDKDGRYNFIPNELTNEKQNNESRNAIKELQKLYNETKENTSQQGDTESGKQSKDKTNDTTNTSVQNEKDKTDFTVEEDLDFLNNFKEEEEITETETKSNTISHKGNEYTRHEDGTYTKPDKNGKDRKVTSPNTIKALNDLHDAENVVETKEKDGYTYKKHKDGRETITSPKGNVIEPKVKRGNKTVANANFSKRKDIIFDRETETKSNTISHKGNEYTRHEDGTYTKPDKNGKNRKVTSPKTIQELNDLHDAEYAYDENEDDSPFSATNEANINTTPQQKAEAKSIVKFLSNKFKGLFADGQKAFDEKMENLGMAELLKDKNGTVFGLYDPKENKIYLNERNLNPKTVWHEATHFQQAILKAMAGKGNTEAKAILSQFDKLLKPFIAQLEKGKTTVTINGQDIPLKADVYRKGKNESTEAYRDRMQDEVWAFLQQEENNKLWQKNDTPFKRAVNKFKEAITNLYKSVFNIPKGKDISNMTLAELVGHTAKQLQEGRLISPKDEFGKKINGFLNGLFRSKVNLTSSIRFSIIKDNGKGNSYNRNQFKKYIGEKNADFLRKNFSNIFSDSDNFIEFSKRHFPIKGDIIHALKSNPDVIERLYEKHLGGELDKDINKNGILTPKELLGKKGYKLSDVIPNLDMAKTLFYDYYLGEGSDMNVGGSIICTMGSKSRFNENYVMWIVKDNAENQPRATHLTEKNMTPEWAEYLEKNGRKNEDGTFNLEGLKDGREDPFSTSVLSIQIPRGTNQGSPKIISRYNHDLQKVGDNKNPDIVFGGDLNELAPDLKLAFENQLGVKLTKKDQSTEINGFVQDNKGHYYRYTKEENGVYYGNGFYIKNGNTTLLDAGNQRMVGGFIINASGNVENVTKYNNEFHYGKVEKVNYIKGNEISVTTENGVFVFETTNGDVSKLKSWSNEQYVLDKLGGSVDKNGNITINGDFKIRHHRFWNDRVIEIKGNADFENNQITSLGNLQSIGGYADFENSQITSLGNLQSIGGKAFFQNSQITDLGNLQSIGRDADFHNSQITSLDNLQSIGGNAYFQNSQITSLDNLQSIGGNANFQNSQITSLGNLQSIGGNADFQNRQITSLDNLQSIGGNAFFQNSQITSLGNLQSIGGYAYFHNSQITSLGNLQSIGGDADFQNSQITDLGNLQSIRGYADFENSQITSLGNLQSIGRDAYFENSQSEIFKHLKTNDNNSKETSEVFKNATIGFKESLKNNEGKSFNDFLPDEYKITEAKQENKIRFQIEEKSNAVKEPTISNLTDTQLERLLRNQNLITDGKCA